MRRTAIQFQPVTAQASRVPLKSVEVFCGIQVAAATAVAGALSPVVLLITQDIS